MTRGEKPDDESWVATNIVQLNDNPDTEQLCADVDTSQAIDLGCRIGFMNEDEQSKHGVVWKDIKNPKLAKATIGLAIDASWTQAQKEFNFFRQQLEKQCGDRRPSLEKITSVFFGKDSAVFRIFKDEKLFPEHAEFLQFLGTFFLSCSYQVSTKQLYDKDSRIDKGGALSKVEYSRLWKCIGSASLPSQAERNKSVTPTGLEPFWMKLEGAFNLASRSMFIQGFNEKMQITIDDDKAHFAGNHYTAGLKVVRHVKDNRNGHTCHTMVHSFSQMPIQIAWERQLNDSAETCTERCLSNSITPMAAPNSPGDLRHVSTSKDRAYWSKKLTHEYVMRSGAKIEAATTKRQPSIGMTYSQTLSEKDDRKDIPIKGAKTMFVQETTSHGRKLYCVAYRNGTGGVTLGLSTEHGSIPEWELVLSKPQDLQWYDNAESLTDSAKMKLCFFAVDLDPERSAKAATYTLRDDSKLLAELLLMPIRPLTTTQGTPEWFMLRRFSLTSSTTDRAIACCKGDEHWLRHQPAWKQIKEVLGRIHVSGESEPSIPSANEDDQVPTLRLPDRARQNAAAPAENDAATTEVSLDELLSSEDVVEATKTSLDTGELGIDVIRKVLRDLGHNLSKAASDERKRTADTKAFNDWLAAAPKLRPYYFCKASSLLQIARSLGIDLSDGTTRRDQVRAKVNEHLQMNPEATFQAPAEPTARQPTRAERIADMSEAHKLFHSVVRAGYLDPLKGDAKKHTRRGHQLECHIVRACITEHQDLSIDTPLRLTAACTAPLVERVDKSYARDSIDFIAVSTDDVVEKCIGVEVKARVGNQRDQREIEHAKHIRRLLGKDRTPRQRKIKYFDVDAASKEFALLVGDTHEAVQVLHHSFVYDFDCILLLVGDCNGNVMYGIFVSISEAIRAAYRDVLTDIYLSALEWIYDDTKPQPNEEDLQPVLDEIVVNGGAVDSHSFEMDVALWRDINFNMEFPIPRLARIIPLIFSLWNLIKGGSDATSSLIWHCNYHLPSNENQAIVVARMLCLVAVQIHRLYQLSTAKEDLTFYSCLKRFRDSATERVSYKKTLTMLVNHFLGSSEKHTAPRAPLSVAIPPAVVTPTAATPPARARRSQARILRLDLPMIESGKTPQRNVQAKIDQLDGKIQQGVRLDTQSKVVLWRAKNCSGFPMWCVGEGGPDDPNGKGSRGVCSLCGSQTHVFCLGCKRWLCLSSSDKTENVPDWKDHLIVNGSSPKPLHAQATCFFAVHREGQALALAAFKAAAQTIV